MKKKITSEISGIVFSLPWLVARDEGLFAEEGLEVELVRARGAQRGMRADPQVIVTDPNQIDSIRGHTLFTEQKVDLYRA